MKSKLSIISLLVILSSLFAQDHRILNSTANSLVVEFTPKFRIDTLQIDNQDFIRVDFANAVINNNNFGKPDLRYRILSFGVQNEFGNTFRVISTNYKVLKGKISPIPFGKKVGNFFEGVYKINSDYKTQPHEILLPGHFDYVRNLPVQDVNIFPVQFDLENEVIKIYERIVVEIRFSNSTEEIKPRDDFALNTVVNSEQASNWFTDNRLMKSNTVSTPSVLSTGTWYKFPISEEGIYKIDAGLLTSLGISLSDLDPRTIKIYNNGGKILPSSLAAARPNDLQELAIKVEGESDGVFNEGDFILFYGRGVNFWNYDSGTKKIVRNKNWYSRENYFWLTFGGNTGKRIASAASESSSNTFLQNTTKAFVYNDEDNLNVLKSGVVYVSDEYSSAKKNYTYINSINDHATGTSSKYNYSFANVSETSVPFSIEENGQVILSRNLTAANYNLYQVGTLNEGSAVYSGNFTDGRSVLKINYNTTSQVSKGYLNYFEIEYDRYLKAVENEIVFFSKDTNAVIDYRLSNFSTSDNKVFDVSDYFNVKQIIPEFISGGEIRFKRIQQINNVSKYFALNTSKFKTPSGFERIDNSFVRAQSEGMQYVVITHRDFSQYAQKLVNFRSNESDFPITSKIFYTDEIFNEFSGGINDPTALRDFIKYAYDNWNTKPEYILLFGGGTYDYLNSEGRNNNFVPTYQTTESFHEILSYSFDDYFSRIKGAGNKADLAVGRIPANNTQDAEVSVNKIIFYETNNVDGLWRNRITLVADDGLTSKGNDGSLHTSQSEELSRDHVPSYFDQQKIYLANYPAVITGLGRRKPTVNQALINAINNGTVLLNYIGHGNPDVWAHEFIFERSSTIPQLSNNIYPFLTAATCDFGKFDDPSVESGAEDLMFLPNAGLIGVFTAVRPVYSNQNARLNEKFYDNLFASTNSPIRIGTGYFKTKESATGDNDERFHLFCDPALILAVPKKPVNISSVNGENLITDVQIKALGSVEIKGRVINSDSTTNSAFNGEGIITVFDSKRKVYLEEIRYNVEYQGGLIFRGKVSVINGEFSASFTVPKDISYENQNGKIIAYLFNNETDGIGVTQKIIVGGTDSTVTNDGNGPAIDIYFDDLSYTNAYLVNKDFNLLVKIDDETGLNTTGTGIGHKLEGIINDDDANPIDFTNYFIGDLDAGGKSGLIDYKFSNYADGDYKIKIKAWDVFNNLSSAEEYFTVVGSGGLAIRDVFNYPNPFSSSTYFTFQHNLTEAVDVEIKVYTIAGRLIKEINSYGLNDKFVKVPWDGRDEDGNVLSNGTYLYKLNIKTVDGTISENILGKLAVIR